MCNRIACGFGYVRSTHEYKVVRIHYLDEYYDEGNVEVCTLGSGCGWRAIGNTTYEVATMCGGTGTYASDAIYWTSYNFVVSFDLANEEFPLQSVPPPMENRRYDDVMYELVTLGGHLCLYVDDDLHVEIWALMKSKDSKETWRKEFDINYEAVEAADIGTDRRKLQPILLAKNREIICLYADSVLYCYDTKTNFLKMISDDTSADYFEAVAAIAHVNTLVSLEAIGENSKRYTVRPRRARTPWDDVIDELDRVALGEEIDITRFRLR
ncbi:F-box/kelch-repeat protein At3g06240-like [Papaver somniferum]|uniref:F-box/kelch-repeat protein At3g06240-like n=1 Tax=Papaver somniferum TaxID=3469 RepID=UPI000E6F6DBB|nr:F-box/kelch-repeat protein At3g06240-like [Papaver somniferum]